ncbi:GTP-binding protein [Thalassotalea sp. M1531]|uniref:GTP-binding protein n=1 Tax=Thalassotalea algicola TaxID=2716224 RepID=A0A7Y0LA38_9GAMM|nr:Rab family GTPase [Thalassotalea algicola]NMP30759.1 GTP-binding protein [Thalassotalea algicola]
MISLKICLIGGSAVGKTSLVRRFVDGIFSEKYLTTIGVKIDKKQIDFDESAVQLLVWDIEGTDKFSGFNPRYLNGAAAYIVVLDQSRPDTLEDAISLYQQAKVVSQSPAYLVINKSDLPSKLTQIQLDSLADFEFSHVITTSAKAGDNVEKLFELIAKQASMECEPNGE